MYARLAAGLAAKLVTGRTLFMLVGLLIGAAGWAAWATLQMQSLQQQVGACDEVSRTAEANASANVELARRLASEVRQRELDRQAQEQAQTEWERQREQLQARIIDRQREREVIYATDQDCITWRTGLVCAAIDSSVRESRADADAAGRGRSAGADPDPD